MIIRLMDAHPTLLKIASLTILLLLAPFAWIPLVYEHTYSLIAFDAHELARKYALSSAVSLIAIIGVPFLRSRWARRLLVSIFVIGFSLNYAASSIQGSSLSVHMFSTLFQAKDDIGLALTSYGPQLFLSLLLCVGLLFGLIREPSKKISLGIWFLIVPLIAFISVRNMIVSYRGIIEEFPSPVSVLIQANLGWRYSAVYLGPREELVYTHDIAPKFEKVVFILDESVRGDFLQINDAKFDNTPFLESIKTEFVNFGLASSYANCSAMSRMALRSGARENNFPDPEQQILRQPTFWQYAKLAGYRTVYIDGWKSQRDMHSHLTEYELDYVDRRTDAELRPFAQADDRIADRLAEELAKPGPAFIFVEKIGVHSPYKRQIADDPAYSPTPTSIPYLGVDDARADNMKDYLTGLWSRVDGFFKIAYPALNQPNVFTVYTSDHGVANYQGGYDATHCSGKNAHWGEGVVPLFIFTGDENTKSIFAESALRSYGKANHMDIFPTLISAMGFDPSLVEPNYEAGLVDIPPDRKHRFFIFFPFQDIVEWINIDYK